jgi:hypothetical protein
MVATMQILGAYALFALVSLAILFCVVSCAMIVAAGYEALDWIREHHWSISNMSRRARIALHFFGETRPVS